MYALLLVISDNVLNYIPLYMSCKIQNTDDEVSCRARHLGVSLKKTQAGYKWACRALVSQQLLHLPLV